MIKQNEIETLDHGKIKQVITIHKQLLCSFTQGMNIRICKMISSFEEYHLQIQHSTNAKYTKYLHLGTILLGHKSVHHSTNA